MASELNMKSVVGEKIAVGLSSIQGVTLLPGQVSSYLKFSSGGTLWMGGATLTWGNGYHVAAAETVPFNLGGTFYLAAAGATVVVYLLRGRSAGYEPGTVIQQPV